MSVPVTAIFLKCSQVTRFRHVRRKKIICRSAGFRRRRPRGTAGIAGPAGRSRLAPFSFYREAEKFTKRSSRPPPALASLQSPHEKSNTARQGGGKCRGTAPSPPRTRKRANSRMPGLCPTISRVFYRRKRSGKKIPQGVNAGVVERSFEFVGRFLRQFLQNHVECITRAPCRRNKGEIENETGCAKIRTHSHRVGATLRRQPPFGVAIGCGSTGFGMANKDEPWHRAR
jgi:hypothetical protein